MKNWSLEDEKRLEEFAAADPPVDIDVQAELLGRTRLAIISKRHTLGISRGDRPTVKTEPVQSEPATEQPEENAEWEETSDSAKCSVNDLQEKVQSLKDLIRVCSIDTEKWHIESWKCKSYMGFIKNAQKKIEKVQLYSVAAVLKVKKGVDFKAEVAALIEEAKTHSPKLAPVSSLKKSASGLMLELSIPDLHIGKLAWAQECGESYDSKIAAELFQSAIDDLLSKVTAYQFDEINLIVGNDLLNVDNSENLTTRGTPQACDTRHQKTFMIARQLIQDAVETKLRGKAPKINIIIVPGNHDQQTAWFLGETLSAWFHQCEDVAVDNRPTLRKYIRFGQVLIGYTHGDKEKHADLPLVMATEVPQMWADTRFREMHVGHLHQRSATRFRDIGEHRGVVVRILPSLCAPEDWHVSKGYVGNIRSAEAYIWHKDTGLVGTAVYNVPMSEAA